MTMTRFPFNYEKIIAIAKADDGYIVSSTESTFSASNETRVFKSLDEVKKALAKLFPGVIPGMVHKGKKRKPKKFRREAEEILTTTETEIPSVPEPTPTEEPETETEP